VSSIEQAAQTKRTAWTGRALQDELPLAIELRDVFVLGSSASTASSHPWRELHFHSAFVSLGQRILQQSYTLLTLGLDRNSAPLSRSLVVPLSLGFAGSSAPASARRRSTSSSSKPLTIRLPPDRLLYLLLRWQGLPQALPHVGRTDEPIPPGISTAARGARGSTDIGAPRKQEGDVQSVRSWVGSVRTVSGVSSLTTKNYAPSRNSGWTSWLGGGGRKELTEGAFGVDDKLSVDDFSDEVLLSLYTSFNLIPTLLIHPPLLSDPPIEELVQNGAYTQLGGIDTKVPLNVLRNLQKSVRCTWSKSH
jgi:hypothetical protein